MSNVNNHQWRSRPVLLILLLLAAVGLSSILQFVIPSVVFWFGLRPGGQTMAYVSLLHQLFAFPFWMTCVVWLAARSGRTIWSTWTVPLLLLTIPLLLLAAPMLILLVHFVAIGISFPSGQVNVGDIIYYQWALILRWSLFPYVALAFLFRATTLHLRPMEVVASPNHLTVLSILLLTTVVAIGLSFDALTYRLDSGTRAPIGNLLNCMNLSIFFIQNLITALVWFSTAWLFVARNTKRWIGIVGLIAYLIWSGLYTMVIVPLEMSQVQLPPAAIKTVLGPIYFLGSFTITLFHLFIIFLCVGMMHLAGYRWDIRRRLLEDAVILETRVNGIPPLLGSSIRLNHETQV